MLLIDDDDVINWQHWQWKNLTSFRNTVYDFEFPQPYFCPSEIWNYSPSLEFALSPINYIILYVYFNLPSFEFALLSEGKKGENKTGGNFSLYAV